LEQRDFLSADAVLQWNQAVLAAIRADRPTIGFVTRDLAIVHTAIYYAVNAIDHLSRVFHVHVDAPADADPVAAADAAGLVTASALFPNDTALFQATFQAVLADVPDGPGKTDGLAVGQLVAEQTLNSRATDGANAVVPYTPGTAPGDWRPTPPGRTIPRRATRRAGRRRPMPSSRPPGRWLPARRARSGACRKPPTAGPATTPTEIEPRPARRQARRCESPAGSDRWGARVCPRRSAQGGIIMLVLTGKGHQE
jgi:hypothetical protein